MFIFSGAAAPLCVCAAFELIPSYGLSVRRGKEAAADRGAAGSSRHPPTVTHQSRTKPRLQSPHHHPLRLRLCGRVAAACDSVPGFSQSSSVSAPSRWPAVTWRSDFMGPSVGDAASVTNCARLPPARPPLDRDHGTDGRGAH